MTSLGQDFETYAGDDVAPIFTVLDGNNNPIDISAVSEIDWMAARDAASMASPVLAKTKTGGGIVFVTTGADGKFQVKITDADTTPLYGFYLHRARVTDQFGNRSTVTIGRFQVGLPPSFTYSGDPSFDDKDAVRFYIDDVATPWEFSDEEINFNLIAYPNPMRAAATLANRLAIKYAGAVDKSVGDLRISLSRKSQAYQEMADRLLSQADHTNVGMYIGGVSRADMERVASNSDRPKPPFRLKQFDIPNATDPGVNPDPEDC